MSVTPFRPFYLIDSSAKMPSKVWAPYRHAAIIKTNGANIPTCISDRFGEIVEYSGNLHAGGKIRDAFSDYMAKAIVKCCRLNDAYEIEMMTALCCAPWQIEKIKENQNVK